MAGNLDLQELAKLADLPMPQEGLLEKAVQVGMFSSEAGAYSYWAEMYRLECNIQLPGPHHDELAAANHRFEMELVTHAFRRDVKRAMAGAGLVLILSLFCISALLTITSKLF